MIKQSRSEWIRRGVSVTRCTRKDNNQKIKPRTSLPLDALGRARRLVGEVQCVVLYISENNTALKQTAGQRWLDEESFWYHEFRPPLPLRTSHSSGVMRMSDCCYRHSEASGMLVLL